MKTYALFILIHAAVVMAAHSKIRNGYERDIQVARNGLKGLEAMLLREGELPMHNRSMIKAEIKKHKTFLMYHELTERLLLQFRLIAPEMFDEMDTLQDNQGRVVDVYVIFTPLAAMSGSVAATNNLPMDGDSDTYHSRYGILTASVSVVASRNALLLLAHELGHLSYQVPNLAAYRMYCEQTYNHGFLQTEERGHSNTDPSGQKALLFQKMFNTKYTEYLKDNAHHIETLAALIEEITKTSN